MNDYETYENKTDGNESNDSEYKEPYGTSFIVFLWILTTIFSISTILGNLLVLLAYKYERNIRRQLSNKFIVSLAISDLVIGMEGFPFLTVYVIEMEKWPLGKFMCELWLCIDYTLCLVSILTVLLITVDRYCSVCYPAKYRMWQTENKINMMIILSWIIPFAFFSLMIFGWDVMANEKPRPPEDCYAPFLNNPFVNMSMYIVYYWTTLVAMSVLYRGIHKAARTLEEKSKAKEKQTMALLLGQRCMAQVGVGMLMHASTAESDSRKDSMPRMKPEYTAEFTELIHDSGYITAGNTTTNTSTTTGTTRRCSEPESTKNGICKVLEEEDTQMETKDIPRHSLTPLEICTTSIAEEKDLLEFDDEVCELPNSKDITPTSPADQMPFCLPISRGPSYKKMHNTRLSLRLKHQDSGCSLEFYDSCSCSSSLFADTSVTSMLDFEAILPMLDFIEEVSIFSEDEKTITGGSINSDKVTNSLTVENTPIMKGGSFKRRFLGETLNNKLTRCNTGSVKRVYHKSTCNDHNTLQRSKTGSGKLTNLDKNALTLNNLKFLYSPTTPIVSIINAPNDTTLQSPTTPQELTSEAITCNTAVFDEDSPTSAEDEENPSELPNIKQNHLNQQQTQQQLLTVPKPSAFSRQRNVSVKAHKMLVGNEDECNYRESWQSTLSFDDREKLKEMADAAKEDNKKSPVEDDEDSTTSKHENVSSEDSSAEKRSGSWVATLFTNPTWLLHRRRKVTKAEKRARKAFRTITVIVGTFALFWSPYYIVATIYGFCNHCVPGPLFFFSYYLCYLNSSMNPFAYAFANRLFRKTFIRLLHGDFRHT